MIYSEYLEANIILSKNEQEILLDEYEKIAEVMRFHPDYDNREAVDLMNDGGLLDTIIYHLTIFSDNQEVINILENMVMK